MTQTHPSVDPALTDSVCRPPRTRLALRHWFSGGALTVVTLLVGIVTRPILLRLLGDDRLGAQRVSADLLGHVSLLDFGFVGAITVLLVRSASAHNLTGVQSVLRRGRTYLVPLTLGMFGIAVAMAWFLPDVAGVRGNLATELRWAALVGSLAVLLLPLSLYRAALEATQMGYAVNIALLVQSVLTTGFTILFAWLGWGLMSFAVATLIASTVYNLHLVLALRSTLGDVHNAFDPEPGHQLETPALWPLAWPLLLASMTNRISRFTDSLIVARMFGVSAAFQLDVTHTLIRLVGGQVNVLANASWAALAEIRVRQGTAAFEARLTELIRLVVGLGVVLTGTASAYNQRFVALWVGVEHFGGQLLSFGLFLSSVAFGSIVIFGFLLDQQGDAILRLPAAAVGAAIKVVLSIALGWWLGLAGAALGTAIAYLAVEAWYYPWVVSRRYGVSIIAVVQAHLSGIIRGAPFAVAVWIWATARPCNVGQNWPMLLAELAAAGCSSLTYCWLVVLSGEDRSLWLKRIRARSA